MISANIPTGIKTHQLLLKTGQEYSEKIAKITEHISAYSHEKVLQQLLGNSSFTRARAGHQLLSRQTKALSNFLTTPCVINTDTVPALVFSSLYNLFPWHHGCYL